MNKQPTFKEIISASFAILCLIALIFIYFIPTKVSSSISGGIVIAFVAAFKDFAAFLIGSTSGSQAKDEAIRNTTDNAINQLANSTPIVIPNGKA